MEGTQLEVLPSYQEFEWVINEPTDILPNSLSIFTGKPNLIIDSDS